jgi:ankyrin repeat protein
MLTIEMTAGIRRTFKPLRNTIRSAYRTMRGIPHNPEIIASRNLVMAAAAGNAEEVHNIKTQKIININYRDGAGKTALQNAAQHGYLSIVHDLLQDPRILVNIQDIHGQTALHKAVKNNHQYVVRTLLEHPDIGVDVKDNNGQTPIDIALTIGNREKIVQLLMAKRSQPNVKIDQNEKSRLEKEQRNYLDNQARLISAIRTRRARARKIYLDHIQRAQRNFDEKAQYDEK